MRLAEKKWIRAAGKLQRSSFLLRGLTLLVLSVLLVSASFAWIAMNSDTSSSNMGMNVDYDKFFVEQAYYKYNAKDQHVEMYPGLTDVQFNQYDLVFRSRNRYTPIVATLMMTGTDLDEEGTIDILIKRDSSISPFYTEIKNGNEVKFISKNFSSIMRVTALVGSTYYSNNIDTLYSNVDTANYSTVRAYYTGRVESVPDTSKVFTTTTIGANDTLQGIEKSDVELSIEYNGSDFVTINGKQTLIVYLYFTYDEGYDGSSYNGLIGQYQRTSGSSEIGASGDIMDTSIRFENDLVSIKVSHS